MKRCSTNFYLQPSPLTAHYLFLFSEKNNRIPPPYPGEKVAQGSKQTSLPHGKHTERESFQRRKGFLKWRTSFSLFFLQDTGSALNHLLSGSAAGLVWHLAFVFTSSKYLSPCSVTSFWVTTITASDPLYLISPHRNKMLYWKSQRGATDASELSILY